MKKEILKNYAYLIAKMGAGVKPGQEVVITCDLDQPEFVRLLVEACYELGAKKVVVDWDYQPLAKLHYKYQTLETLSHMEKWKQEKWQHFVRELPCRIYLLSEDPDGLAGIDEEKMALSKQNLYKIIKPYRDAMENRYQWCIAAVPGLRWAKKLFPRTADEEAIEKLWEAILYTSRVIEVPAQNEGGCSETASGACLAPTQNESSCSEAASGACLVPTQIEADSKQIIALDPIAEWEHHNKELKDKCDWLNSLNIESLHYESANGTDLTVGLIPQAHFCGGAERTLSGNIFNPNIPSEECFISPMRGVAEGRVYATKPLSYEGQLIENFWIEFADGKAVAWYAEKNESLLEKIITMDEGSAYLGECALVPYDSPICNYGLLFYNTLFDENAACHLALGMGFPDTIKDFENYSLDEIHKMGVNDSMIHEDFMIGSADMNITATTRDGREIKIFADGNWAQPDQ